MEPALTMIPVSAELAARYKTDGMLAYVELVQRKEKEIGCDVLTHQKWCAHSYHTKWRSALTQLGICFVTIGAVQTTSTAS